nr:hypothetical protein [Tanacetum cinerariifolium]
PGLRGAHRSGKRDAARNRRLGQAHAAAASLLHGPPARPGGVHLGPKEGKYRGPARIAGPQSGRALPTARRPPGRPHAARPIGRPHRVSARDIRAGRYA